MVSVGGRGITRKAGRVAGGDESREGPKSDNLEK